MKCPTCGEKARTTHTRNKKNCLVVRYRECRKGHRFRTEERPVQWQQPNLAKSDNPPPEFVSLRHAEGAVFGIIPAEEHSSEQDVDAAARRSKAQADAKAKEKLRRILREIREEERQADEDDEFWPFAGS